MKNMTWTEVNKNHKTVTGIYTTGGKAVSLLVNANPKTAAKVLYPNKVTSNEIIYYVGASTPIHGINALFKAVENKTRIKVYKKLDVNQWQDLGDWEAIELMQENDGYWPVKLKPVK